MIRQNVLFPDMENEPAEPEPRGFRYRDEIITEVQQEALVESLRQLDLKPVDFHGHLGNRRVTSFGLKYDYSRRIVEPAGEMPTFLENLLHARRGFRRHGPERVSTDRSERISSGSRHWVAQG